MKHILNKTILFAIFISLLVLFSCDEYNKRNPYFTFGQVGNEWTYEFVEISTPDRDTVMHDTITYRIISDDGGGLYTYEYSYAGNLLTGQWFITPTEFGYSLDNILLNSASVIDDINIGDNCILEVNDTIEIMGEDISCFKIRNNYSLYPDGTTYWVHPDYGIVKEQVDIIFELTERKYTLIGRNF